MKFLFGKLLLINSAILFSYLFACNATFAEEVAGKTVATVNQNSIETNSTANSSQSPASEQSVSAQASPQPESQIAQTTPQSEITQSNSVESNNIEQIQRYSNEQQDNLGQVTNVSQFRDVQPSDWAYEALSRVVQTYGCLQGYPDGTYRGNRALSRYEFAAGLNACLRQIEALISRQPQPTTGGTTTGGVSPSDLQALQRLTEEFRTELATLGTRVDNLEGRTAFIEQRQFSTTTKLVGEAVFALTDGLGKNNNVETVLQDRVRIDFQTSFTGKDVLHTRLAASNANQTMVPDIDIAGVPGGTGEGTQTFNLTGGSANNNFVLDWLGYYLPLGDKLQAYVAAYGGIHSDYVLSTANPYLEDYTGGNGALSHFAEENPIFSIGGGAGAGLSYKLSNALGVSVGYLAGGNTSAANPNPGNGLLDGDYAALAQLNLNPGGRFQVGLTYVNSYHTLGGPIFNLGGPSGQGRISGGSTGTVYANNPGTLLGFSDTPVQANSYGASASFQLSPRLAINSWFSYTKADILAVDKAEIWNYAVALAFPDLGKKGNLGGIIVGAEPYLGGFSNSPVPTNDIPLHIEGFYRYQLTDNVSITPGVIVLTALNQNQASDDVIIGTLRTTFRF
ncbi:MAG: iron uptake porin [Crinalium sp.]